MRTADRCTAHARATAVVASDRERAAPGRVVPVRSGPAENPGRWRTSRPRVGRAPVRDRTCRRARPPGGAQARTLGGGARSSPADRTPRTAASPPPVGRPSRSPDARRARRSTAATPDEAGPSQAPDYSPSRRSSRSGRCRRRRTYCSMTATSCPFRLRRSAWAASRNASRSRRGSRTVHRISSSSIPGIIAPRRHYWWCYEGAVRVNAGRADGPRIGGLTSDCCSAIIKT